VPRSSQPDSVWTAGDDRPSHRSDCRPSPPRRAGSWLPHRYPSGNLLLLPAVSWKNRMPSPSDRSRESRSPARECDPPSRSRPPSPFRLRRPRRAPCGAPRPAGPRSCRTLNPEMLPQPHPSGDCGSDSRLHPPGRQVCLPPLRRRQTRPQIPAAKPSSHPSGSHGSAWDRKG
jgi:hypothetical protein